MGSQASPFAPPDTGIRPARQQEQPRKLEKTSRAESGPFRPPEGAAEFREDGRGGGRHYKYTQKKTRRGGWQPDNHRHHHHSYHDDDDHVIGVEEEEIEEDDDLHQHHVDEYKAPILNPAHDVSASIFG